MTQPTRIPFAHIIQMVADYYGDTMDTSDGVVDQILECTNQSELYDLFTGELGFEAQHAFDFVLDAITYN